MHSNRRQTMWLLAALLAVCASASVAAEGDCTVQLKITSLGVPTITESARSMMRGVGQFRYRLDAASDEKQCVNATFNFMQRYLDKDGKPALSTTPGAIRFRGGQGSEFGELSGRREDSRMTVTIEDVRCKRC